MREDKKRDTKIHLPTHVMYVYTNVNADVDVYADVDKGVRIRIAIEESSQPPRIRYPHSPSTSTDTIELLAAVLQTAERAKLSPQIGFLTYLQRSCAQAVVTVQIRTQQDGPRPQPDAKLLGKSQINEYPTGFYSLLAF